MLNDIFEHSCSSDERQITCSMLTTSSKIDVEWRIECRFWFKVAYALGNSIEWDIDGYDWLESTLWEGLIAAIDFLLLVLSEFQKFFASVKRV